jgi:hypothetical protein
MPLTVVSFATYLSAPGTQWRFKDWDAYKYVQALKGNQIKKFARIPVLGTLRRGYAGVSTGRSRNQCCA